MRFWPRSLLGQVLLAVAGALLLAQAISAVLLFRAAEERRAQQVVGTLAVQLTAASTGAPAERLARRFGDRPGERLGLAKRLRIERSATPPALPDDEPEAALTRDLREVLSQQGLSGADKVRVVSRAAMADPRVLRRIEAGRMLGGAAPIEDARVILASVPGNDGQWVTARAIDRQPTARGVRGLVTQTLVLFGALMLVMWLLLRRITRPLAQLTGRVEAFARTQDLTGQLEPQGPDDVRQLIEAHNAMEARIAAIGTKPAKTMVEWLEFFERFDEEKYGSDGGPLHDPTVVAYLLKPELFSGRHCNVEIELQSELTVGMTVVDWWRVSGREPNATFMRNVDADGFFALLTERFARL